MTKYKYTGLLLNIDISNPNVKRSCEGSIHLKPFNNVILTEDEYLYLDENIKKHLIKLNNTPVVNNIKIEENNNSTGRKIEITILDDPIEEKVEIDNVEEVNNIIEQENEEENNDLKIRLKKKRKKK